MMRGLTLILLLSMTIVACRRGDREEAEVMADTTSLTESAESVTEMLTPLRAVSLAEVEFGDLATQRSSHAEVRDYARVIAADHRALVRMVDSVAAVHAVTLQETQSAQDLANAARIAHSGLESMEGADFDLAFIRAEVETHRQLLDALDRQVLPMAWTPPMQQFLGASRAMVDAHLTRARQILAMLLGQTFEPETGTSPAPAQQQRPTQQSPTTTQQPPATTQPPPTTTQPPPDTIPAAAR